MTNSKTLIDNIFSNDPSFAKSTSGNFTFSISDHLPQFLIIPHEINHPPKKHNIFKRKKNFSREDLVADFFQCSRGSTFALFDSFEYKLSFWTMTEFNVLRLSRTRY